jgi:Gluconate 2-dehydrogenase subunit 3
MKRRKAIARIALIGGGTAAAFSGYTWYELAKTPDISYLIQKKELISALAETIIPATGTPGARDAGVEDFIVTTLRDCAERINVNRFIYGLKELEHYTASNYQRDFMHCTEAEKQKILEYFRQKSHSQKGLVSKIRNKLLGMPFYTTLRVYTIIGFCTSEKGATQALSYLLIPGKYIGCMPLQPGQTSWATK